jgi:hypothetical protein
MTRHKTHAFGDLSMRPCAAPKGDQPLIRTKIARRGPDQQLIRKTSAPSGPFTTSHEDGLRVPRTISR